MKYIYDKAILSIDYWEDDGLRKVMHTTTISYNVKDKSFDDFKMTIDNMLCNIPECNPELSSPKASFAIDVLEEETNNKYEITVNFKEDSVIVDYYLIKALPPYTLSEEDKCINLYKEECNRIIHYLKENDKSKMKSSDRIYLYYRTLHNRLIEQLRGKVKDDHKYILTFELCDEDGYPNELLVNIDSKTVTDALATIQITLQDLIKKEQYNITYTCTIDFFKDNKVMYCMNITDLENHTFKSELKLKDDPSHVISKGECKTILQEYKFPNVNMHYPFKMDIINPD